MLLGIDEAGRGPVIGPMIVAGVAAPEGVAKRFSVEHGARDSKKLSPGKREELARMIEREARVFIEVVPPSRIDEERKRFSLNEIEMRAFGRIVDRAISELPVKRIVFDLPEASTRFESFLEKRVPRGVELVGEHGADHKYPIVSMASIIAKVERDKRVRDIERVLGFPVGSGYPHDPVTMRALERIVSTGVGLEHVRRSWATYKRVASSMGQKGLGSFL